MTDIVRLYTVRVYSPDQVFDEDLTVVVRRSEDKVTQFPRNCPSDIEAAKKKAHYKARMINAERILEAASTRTINLGGSPTLLTGKPKLQKEALAR